jgi:hypothetical protein
VTRSSSVRHRLMSSGSLQTLCCQSTQMRPVQDGGRGCNPSSKVGQSAIERIAFLHTSDRSDPAGIPRAKRPKNINDYRYSWRGGRGSYLFVS